MVRSCGGFRRRPRVRQAVAAGSRVTGQLVSPQPPSLSTPPPLQCCCLLDDDAHMPAGVTAALECNGVASVHFAALSLSANATVPRWLRKVFLGHRGSDLVVALRDAMQPGDTQLMRMLICYA